MPLVTTADRKHFRFADIGTKIHDGEKQLFYCEGPNGGIILDRKRTRAAKRRRIRWLALHILYFTFNRTPENQRV